MANIIYDIYFHRQQYTLSNRIHACISLKSTSCVMKAMTSWLNLILVAHSFLSDFILVWFNNKMKEDLIKTAKKTVHLHILYMYPRSDEKNHQKKTCLL